MQWDATFEVSSPSPFYILKLNYYHSFFFKQKLGKYFCSANKHFYLMGFELDNKE